MVVTVLGSVLVSTDLPAVRAGVHQRAPGLPLAIGAAFGFGVAAFLLAYVVRHSDWIVGLWASRLAQVVCYLPLVAAFRTKLGKLRSAAATGIAVAMLAGAADIVGVMAYSLGTERGFVTIVLGASAVFPLIPVVLSHAGPEGGTVGGEPVRRHRVRDGRAAAPGVGVGMILSPSPRSARRRAS